MLGAPPTVARSDPSAGTTLAAMDAATRWETEAMRASRRPQVSKRRTDWATLREASEATHVPIGTIRSWAKSGAVDTYLESDGETPVRMVDLDAVRERAAGRRDMPGGEEPRVTDAAPRGDAEAAEAPTAVEPGTMIVPIDAWNKMLLQLGNLHEAGQQLAEARERAARAETEAAFLRRQLKELKTSDSAEPANVANEEEPQGTADAPASERARSTSFVRYIYRGWRSRRKPRP